VPALAAFAAKHPQLRIQHVSSSKNDDLIAGRFDVATGSVILRIPAITPALSINLRFWQSMHRTV